MLPHSPAGAGRDQGGIPGHGPRGGLSRLFPVGSIAPAGSEPSWMQGKAEGGWEGARRQRRGRKMRKARGRRGNGRESAAGVGETFGGAGAAGADFGGKSGTSSSPAQSSRVGFAARLPSPAHFQLSSHLEPPISIVPGGGKAPTQPGNRRDGAAPTPCCFPAGSASHPGRATRFQGRLCQPGSL